MAYDPNDHGVDDVLAELESAGAAEQKRILAAEVAGKKRRTILRAYDIDPDQRFDASGRSLYPWEVDPAEGQAVAVEVQETDEQRAAREAQAEFDAKAEAAAPANDQGGVTGAGVGVADGGVAVAGSADGGY